LYYAYRWVFLLSVSAWKRPRQLGLVTDEDYRIMADMRMKHKCLDWKRIAVSERNAVSRFYRNKEHFRIEKDQPTPKLFIKIRKF